MNETQATITTYIEGKSVQPSKVLGIPTDFNLGTSHYNEVILGKYSFHYSKETKTGYVLQPARQSANGYPVLYLLHGLGNNAYQEWIVQGNIQQIIGYMMANGTLIQPMIVVMPDIFKDPGEDLKPKEKEYNNLASFLVANDGLMNYIKDNYPVLTGEGNSSIAGLSMGGLAALSIGCRLQNDFISVGSFSPSDGLFYEGNPLHLNSPEDFTFGNGQDHFIFIGKGDSDTTVGHAPEDYRDTLNTNKNNNAYCTLAGQHNWDCFTKELYLFLLNQLFI